MPGQVNHLQLLPCVCLVLQRLQTDIQLGDADTLRKTYVNLANTHLCLRQYSKAVEYYE